MNISMKNNNKNKAAFFDVDGVMVRGTGIFYYAQSLLKYHAIDKSFFLKFPVAFLLHALGFTREDWLARFFYNICKVKEVDRLKSIARETFVSITKEKMLEGGRDLLKEYRMKGYRIVLATALPDFVVQPIAEDLGVSEVIASEVKMHEGMLTPEPQEILPYRRGKAKRIAIYAIDNKIDLENSYFFSNDYTDLPSFRLVGNKVTVNPVWRLRRKALKSNWPIIDYKK